MLYRNKRRIQSNYQSENFLWMDLGESGRIWDTLSNMRIIYGSKKDQYGGILRGSIKPQATRPQAKSRHLNHMYVINNEVTLDDKYEYVIK